MSVVAELARARACVAHRVVGRTLDGRPLDMLVFGGGPAPALARRAPAPRREHGRVARRGLRAPARRRRRPQGARAARARDRARDPEHEPGRLGARLPAHERGRREPQPRVGGASTRGLRGADARRVARGGEWRGARGGLPARISQIGPPRCTSREGAPPPPSRCSAWCASSPSAGCLLPATSTCTATRSSRQNFISGAEGVPRWDESMAALQDAFLEHFKRASPTSRSASATRSTSRAAANLSVCSNAIAEKFGCLGVTLEQPFKDSTFHTPEPVAGWSAPARCGSGRGRVGAPRRGPYTDRAQQGAGGEAGLAKTRALTP